VRALTSSSGTLTATFTYNAWGTTTGSTGTATLPFGFAGYYYDGASGFYYLRARWYDAGTGQWMSLDPMVMDTQSPFAYVNNDPVNGVDPSGQASWQSAGAEPPACSGEYTEVYNNFHWKFADGGSGTAILYCGNSAFGLKHILAHYQEFVTGSLSAFNPTWRDFVLFMASTLADWNAYKRNPNATVTYVINNGSIGFKIPGTRDKRPVTFSVIVAQRNSSIITASAGDLR
jgi:RHS repeat-associated protein